MKRKDRGESFNVPKYMRRNLPTSKLAVQRDSGADIFTVNPGAGLIYPSLDSTSSQAMLSPRTGRKARMGSELSLGRLPGLHTVPVLVFVSPIVIVINLAWGGILI